MTRDPQLGRLLGAALPSGTPRPGAEERVLERLRERQRGKVAPPRARPLAVAVAAALVVLALGASGAWMAARPAANVAAPRAVSALATHEASPAGELAATTSRRFEAGAADQLLALSGSKRVLVRAGSLVEVSEQDAHTECRLLRGEVLVHVPEGSRAKFAVVTATLRVEVTGTVFGVSADTSELSRVTVWDGHVRLLNAAESESVSAGEHWPRDATALRVTRSDLVLLDASERVTLTLLDVEPSGRAEARVGHLSQQPRSFAAPKPDVYAQARRVESSGDRRAAARLYERAASEAGPSGEAAAFAAARLYVGLGDEGSARRVLSSYRAGFPQGLYARAADVLWLRLLLAQGDLAGVEREAATFLQNYPDDPRAVQFRRGRALERARHGHCSAAQADLLGLDPDVRAQVRALCPARDEP